MNIDIKSPEDYFNAVKDASIEYKQKCINMLQEGVETKGNGKWDAGQCSAIENLIDRIKISIVIEL